MAATATAEDVLSAAGIPEEVGTAPRRILQGNVRAQRATSSRNSTRTDHRDEDEDEHEDSTAAAGRPACPVPALCSSEVDAMAGDVNLFFGSGCGEYDIEEGAETATWIELWRSRFRRPPTPGGAAHGRVSDPLDSPVATVAEIMVMTAAPRFRRRGHGHEAVLLIARYAMDVLGVRRLVAKISDSNTASVAMFTGLGFKVAKEVEAFQEVHMVADLLEMRTGRVCAGAGALVRGLRIGIGTPATGSGSEASGSEASVEPAAGTAAGWLGGAVEKTSGLGPDTDGDTGIDSGKRKAVVEAWAGPIGAGLEFAIQLL